MNMDLSNSRTNKENMVVTYETIKKDMKKGLKDEAFDVRRNTHAFDANGDRINVLSIYGLKFSTSGTTPHNSAQLILTQPIVLRDELKKPVPTYANVCESDEKLEVSEEDVL